MPKARARRDADAGLRGGLVDGASVSFLFALIGCGGGGEPLPEGFEADGTVVLAYQSRMEGKIEPCG